MSLREETKGINSKEVIYNFRLREVIINEKLKDKLRDMRSSAIQRGGEFAVENLVFKELRNRGYLDKMSQHLRNLKVASLSID